MRFAGPMRKSPSIEAIQSAPRGVAIQVAHALAIEISGQRQLSRGDERGGGAEQAAAIRKRQDRAVCICRRGAERRVLGRRSQCPPSFLRGIE